jgi:hypothetical protein
VLALQVARYHPDQLENILEHVGCQLRGAASLGGALQYLLPLQCIFSVQQAELQNYKLAVKVGADQVPELSC